MSRNEVELDFKFDIEKVLKHAKEVGFEIVEKTEENEQGGLFYKDENGELVKWDVMEELFPFREMSVSDEAIDRIEERLVEAKEPVGKPFEHKNKKSINLNLENRKTYVREDLQHLEDINNNLRKMSNEEVSELNEKIEKDIQLEKIYLDIKDKIQKLSEAEIGVINKSLREVNNIAMTVDETDLLINKISGKESKIGKSDFCVLEISKDDLGHEYEAVYEVVNGLENAINICHRLNKNNDDDDAYYEVQYVDPDNL